MMSYGYVHYCRATYLQCALRSYARRIPIAQYRFGVTGNHKIVDLLGPPILAVLQCPET